MKKEILIILVLLTSLISMHAANLTSQIGRAHV